MPDVYNDNVYTTSLTQCLATEKVASTCNQFIAADWASWTVPADKKGVRFASGLLVTQSRCHPLSASLSPSPRVRFASGLLLWSPRHPLVHVKAGHAHGDWSGLGLVSYTGGLGLVPPLSLKGHAR